MKLKLTLFTLLFVFTTCAFAQAKKASLIGIHFNLADFKAPSGIKDAGSAKVYSSVKEMSQGFSLSYWKGLTSKIDLSVKANTMFYSKVDQVADHAKISFELEPTINIRPFSDAALLAPFLTAGIGGGLYDKEFAAYVPAGVGLQLNLQKLSYIFLQAQYKFTLNDKIIGDNLFYSVGFAQNF